MSNTEIKVRRLTAEDGDRVPELLAVLASAFEDPDQHLSAVTTPAYVSRNLANPNTIVVVALAGGAIVGGAICYILNKIEREAPEFYLYDIGVVADFQRRGVATLLIKALAALAKESGALSLYVQTEHASDNVAPTALYSGLGSSQAVLHFDIDLSRAA